VNLPSSAEGLTDRYPRKVSIHDREHLHISSAKEFRKWLSKNGDSPGVWLVFPKKSSGLPTATYDELVREALCFGWVDSVPGKVDAVLTKLYFSPRKPGSGWAATNKQRIMELEKLGLLQAAGREAVERAKQDGSWNLIDGSESLIIPNDLTKAFRRHKGSKAHFEAFPPGVRKQILQWIEQAKTSETRDKRIQQTAELAAQNIRANTWRPKK